LNILSNFGNTDVKLICKLTDHNAFKLESKTSQT